jgi:hypothetical protein
MLSAFISTHDIRHPCTPNAGGPTVVESGKMLHIRHKSRDIDNDSTAPGSYRSRLAVPRWVVGSGPSPKHCPACHARQSKGTSARVPLAHNAAQAMSKTAGCWEASTPPTARPGSGRDESRSRSARTGEANKVRQDVEWSRARGRPRVLSAAGAAAGAPGGGGWREAGRGKPPRPLCAGRRPRAPRAARAAGAASTQRARVVVTEMRTRNATFDPARQARDNQDRLQIVVRSRGSARPRA